MNRKEFENIVPELRPLMVKVARDFFGNQDDAEDVAQDALVRLWNYLRATGCKQEYEATGHYGDQELLH